MFPSILPFCIHKTENMKQFIRHACLLPEEKRSLGRIMNAKQTRTERGRLFGFGRILCLQMNAIGDTIMTQPAWRSIKRQFPDASIDLLCRPHIAPLFARDPALNRILVSDVGTVFPWRLKKEKKFVTQFLHTGYDGVIDFTGLPLTARLCAQAPAAFAVGLDRVFTYGRKNIRMKRAYDRSIPYSDTQHFRCLFADLVSTTLGVEGCEETPSLSLSADILSAAKNFLHAIGFSGKEVIVLHPGAKWIPKRWPTRYWHQLAGLVCRLSGEKILVVGSDSDREMVQDIVGGLPPDRVRSFVGGGLDLVAGLIRLSALCVCNDSAAMHIASAVETPSIALFGPVSPDRSAPFDHEGCHPLYDRMFCSPCPLYYSRNRCRRGINFCLYAIRPGQVFEKIKSLCGRE